MQAQQSIEGYELSPQQLALWREMHGEEFGVQCEVFVEGDVDRARLDQAIATVLSRHEILRTSYERMNGREFPFQVIGERLVNDVEVSFDKGLLTIKLGALSGDRRSLHNLIKEIAAAYAMQPLPPVLQYADLAQWQNELLTSEETRGGREYWERVEAAPEPVLPFANSGGGELGQVSFSLSGTAQSKLVEFCRQRNVTKQAVLLAAWAALLARLSSQARVRLYLIADGRRQEETISAVGLFARRLPLTLQLEGSFATVLTAVSEQVEAAERWQEYHEPSEGGGYGFEFFEWPAPIEAAGLRFTITSARVRLWRPRLSLSIDSECCAVLEYDAAAFTIEDAERLSEEYVTLLDSAIAASESPIEGLD